MDIDKILQENSSKIASEASKAEELREKWLIAQENYDNLEAKHVLILKTTMEGLKSTEIKYYVGENETLHSKRMELVGLESAFRKVEVNVRALEEELRAAKRLAQIEIAQLENIDFGIRRKENQKNGMGK